VPILAASRPPILPSPPRNPAPWQVFDRLLAVLDEKYRALVLQEKSAGSGYPGEEEISSEAFVRALHEVGMAAVQDPKAESDDKTAGLGILRLTLKIDDSGKGAPRRIDCATLLRDVLENKMKQRDGPSTIERAYDLPVSRLTRKEGTWCNALRFAFTASRPPMPQCPSCRCCCSLQSF